MEFSQNEQPSRLNFYSDELELAMNTIFDLYSNLQLTRKELNAYKFKESQKALRAARFASKVNDMFN